MAFRLASRLVLAGLAIALASGLVAGVQGAGQQAGPADLIIHNGVAYPADGSSARPQAVAVRGDRILRVGSNQEILALRRETTTVLDARGGSILPGFNDAHVHFISGGQGLERVNLLDAFTLDDILKKIRAFAEANPARPWVEGRGWYYEPFPGGLPTRQQLDAIVPDRPARMVCYDGHTSWVNTKALQAAGITKDTPSPKNGEIVKDPKTGEPTGVLKETAQQLVSKVLPPTTREDRLRALRAAVKEANRLGVTSVQNAGGSPEELELFDAVRKRGDLKVRVYYGLSVGSDLDEAGMDKLDAVRRRFPDDPLLKTGVIKIMVDGVIESYTAAMLAPYSTKPVSGDPMWTSEQLDRVVTALDRRGWQIMIHAIGDRGIRMSLDAYERAAAANPAPTGGRRHRIEHIETTDAADIPRFGKLGVIASLEPFHANPSQNQIGVWEANVGPARAARGWAYRSISAGGGRLAFGSDWPVVTLDPRFGMHMAVNRTTPEGTPAGGWHAHERIPLIAALDAYTSGAAYASFDEHRKGTLAPGMLADLVVMTKDLFAQPSARILDAEVAATVFDGKVVFENK
jgi:hypothetical protein